MGKEGAKWTSREKGTANPIKVGSRTGRATPVKSEHGALGGAHKPRANPFQPERPCHDGLTLSLQSNLSPALLRRPGALPRLSQAFPGA